MASKQDGKMFQKGRNLQDVGCLLAIFIISNYDPILNRIDSFRKIGDNCTTAHLSFALNSCIDLSLNRLKLKVGNYYKMWMQLNLGIKYLI
jgi:hypothetical protein